MGESARKPGAPTLPLTVEELLTTRSGEGFSWMEKYVPTIVFTTISALTPCVYNWRIRRPFFAAIYSHIILGGVGYFIGEKVSEYRRAQRSEKDAILLHYISLHPEDFPPIERQRYKDLFLTWTPSR